MSEFEDIYGDEFFIIDSNKLNEVETKFYGYVINEGKIYTSKNIMGNEKLSGLGAYIYINEDFNEITINQDANGSYGLYVYKNQDVFCISNSFLKLLEYVKNKYPISFNEDAAAALLAFKYSSYIYKQTLVNEIQILPRNYIIKINKIDKTLRYDIIDFEDKTIPLDSKRAFDILDDWFYRWTHLFRNLKKETNNISVDLTGGFDSRVTFALLLAANIDLSQIHINSYNDAFHTHKEDYQIASEIAKEFDFKLNDFSKFDLNRYYFEELDTSMKISAYLKFGTHFQPFYNYYKNVNTVYSITGYFGEEIRNFANMVTLDQFITNAEMFSPELVEPTKRVIDYNINHLKKDFNGRYNDDNIDNAINRETMHTYHFGRGTIEKFFRNEFSLSPLSDPEINKIKRHDNICMDKNLLITIIFLRYCPKLLEFDFNGNFGIKNETIEYAKKINEKYSFEFAGYELVSSNIETCHKVHSHNAIDISKIDDFIKSVFFSKTFERYFEVYYSPNLYANFVSFIKRSNYIPLQYAYPAISIIKVKNDIDPVKNSNEDLIEWLSYFNEMGNDYDYPDSEIIQKLLVYNTARLDIINYGLDNNVEIVYCSDKNSIPRNPHWIKPESGGGVIIESYVNSVDLIIKCIQDGEIEISLRGKDVRDKNRNRFPVYIDYTQFKVDGETILDENILITHDKSYVYRKKVIDGEQIKIHVEWKPFDNLSEYIYN